jgi:hypothetical protein
MRRRHRTRTAAVALAAALVLASCADGGESRPSVDRTRLPSQLPSRTASLPSPTALPTRSDSSAEPEPEPEPSDSSKTSEPASETPTETPSETVPETPSATPTPSPTDSSRPTATAEASPTTPPEDADNGTAEEATDVPAGVWWLLAAFALGLAIGVPLVLRSRRRRAWQSAFATSRAEATWLTRELLPELRRAGSQEQVAGGWAVSSARVGALEDDLTALEATAPGDPDRAQARALRDAVRAARVRVESLAVPGSGESTSAVLDGVINDLELALRPAGPESHRS